jgi:predicted O-methyltransferase YrrM
MLDLSRLRGILPPILTPLTDQEEIDLLSLRRLIEYVLDGGVHGIWVTGTTGEFPCIDERERASVVATTVEAVNGRVPVVASIGDCSTRLAIRHAKTGVRYVFTEIRNNAEMDDAVFAAAAFSRLESDMSRAALEEAVRGIELTAGERSMLEEEAAFSPHEGRMLFDLIRQRGYTRALEIGKAYGNSAVWMAMALKRNVGKLVTIEKEPAYAKVAREVFAKAGLADAIDSRVNDAFQEIRALAGDFDLVFMDTGTNLHRKFLEMVVGRVKPGGAVISHNADTFDRDQPDFRRAVMEDPHLETWLVLNPGGGMSISIVRPLQPVG